MTKTRSSGIALVMVLSIAVVGCKKATPAASVNDTTATNTVAAEGRMMSPMAMLANGQKLKCTTTTEAGGSSHTATMHFDGGSYRMESMMGDKTVYALFDGTTFYSWGMNSGKGTKMTVECLEKFKEMAKSLPQGQAPTYRSSDELVREPNIDCSPVASVDLTIPTDITFVDQCAMMEQSMEMMKRFAPAGQQ
jgi:hypothetical protein